MSYFFKDLVVWQQASHWPWMCTSFPKDFLPTRFTESLLRYGGPVFRYLQTLPKGKADSPVVSSCIFWALHEAPSWNSLLNSRLQKSWDISVMMISGKLSRRLSMFCVFLTPLWNRFVRNARKLLQANEQLRREVL